MHHRPFILMPRKPKSARITWDPRPAPGSLPDWLVEAVDASREDLADFVAEVRFQVGLVLEPEHRDFFCKLSRSVERCTTMEGHRLGGRPQVAADELLGLVPGYMGLLDLPECEWIGPALAMLPLKRQEELQAGQTAGGEPVWKHLGRRPSTTGYVSSMVERLRMLPDESGKPFTRNQAILSAAKYLKISPDAVESAVDRSNRSERKTTRRKRAIPRRRG